MNLLTTANYKTSKGLKAGVMTGILHLAPAILSGYEVCPMRSAGCTKACLNTAGRGRFTTVEQARIRRTKMFFEERPSFMAMLRGDIAKLYLKAKKASMTPAVRLNGTSDIEWTRTGIMDEFPDVQFYDYTAVLNRLEKPKPGNYSLTFSRKENNDEKCMTAIKLGYNVACVFNTKKDAPLPKSWNDVPVYDGDETDARFLDPQGGYIIGLRAKGLAKKDYSGFVIHL